MSLKKTSSTFVPTISYGRQDGIRTHGGPDPVTPLAGERLQPLGHLSTISFIGYRLRFQEVLRE